MPKFTIEAQYMLPVYRHSTYEAASLEAACQMAIDGDEWENEVKDYECARPTYVAAAWEGETAYPEGNERGLPIPPQYEETVQRKAELFDEMLAALRKTNELFTFFTDHEVFDYAAAEVHPDFINATCDIVAAAIAKAESVKSSG